MADVTPPATEPGRTGRGVDGWLRRAAVPVVIVVALSAGGLAMCGVPGDSLEDGAGIAGTYVVNGVDPVGIEYSGTVTIRPVDPGAADTYDIQWLVTGAILHGTGRLRGDRLTVDWETVTSPRGTSSGTAEYEVGADGVLRGERSIDGADGVGTEEIFPEP